MQVTRLAGANEQKTWRALPVRRLPFLDLGPLTTFQEQGLDQQLEDAPDIVIG